MIFASDITFSYERLIKKLLFGSIAGKKSPIAFVSIISKVFVTSDLNLVESTDESAFL